jgi:ribose transport system ATP-binding protein
MTDATGSPLLEMRGIVKSYPGVQALRGVDLTLGRGEVLALIGENGAGKSTLMKVLGGATAADSGTISLSGRDVHFRSPHDSRTAGVSIIYQEFNLVPALTASENIFLGQEPVRGGFIRRRVERRRSRELFGRLGIDIDFDTPCGRLTTAQQQLVEIAKALALESRLIVMDEPTAALTARETERLFAIIRDLKSHGIGVIYITHRLDEVFAITDRVTVLRDGKNVGARSIGDITRQQMVEMMVGRELTGEFPQRTPAIGEPLLEVAGLSRGNAVRDVSFHVRRGEILAITGLVGAGRTEMVRLIFGADRRDAGEIHLAGKRLNIHSPADAIDAGIGLLTEDRKHQGLSLIHSVRENFGLPSLVRLSQLGFVRQRQERGEFAEAIRSLKIRVADQEQRAGNLSGGNQQKIVLAKWLARNCQLLIFDEPTRGIDVGARYEIYQLLGEFAAQGKAIVMISSDLPEALGMADRILVMRGGRITGEIPDARRATQEEVMKYAMA